MTRVLGLDVSANATGLALPSGRCETFRPRTTDVGERLRRISAHIAAVLAESRPEVAVIEGYAHHARGALSTIRLAEVGGAVRLALRSACVPWVEVPPMKLKRFAAGTGAATKDLVVGAAREAGAVVEDDNQADAWWLRAMGRLGIDGVDVRGLPRLAVVRAGIVAGIAWPEVAR